MWSWCIICSIEFLLLLNSLKLELSDIDSLKCVKNSIALLKWSDGILPSQLKTPRWESCPPKVQFSITLKYIILINLVSCFYRNVYYFKDDHQVFTHDTKLALCHSCCQIFLPQVIKKYYMSDYLNMVWLISHTQLINTTET